MSDEIPDIVEWAESKYGFYLPSTKRPILLARHQKDILRYITRRNEKGRFLHETNLLSGPKKSGKTTKGAVATLHHAIFVDPPNEIFICANDLDQSIGRVFRDVAMAIRLNPYLDSRTKIRKSSIIFDNGTTIVALPADYAGAAGSRHGLVVYDELWAYRSENARRLYDELTPIPTRQNSIRLIVTYAGFEGESILLEELYERGLSGDPIPELFHIKNGRGEPACRANGGLFCYWDHELKSHPGLLKSPEQYHEEQRKELRPNQYARLHLNEFASNFDRFVTRKQWDDCYDPEVIPL